MSNASDPTTAKAKLITDYLLLAQQMTQTAQSMTAYVTALAASPTHENTLSLLVPVPQLPMVVPPFEQHLNGIKGSKIRAADDDEREEGDGKKRKRRKSDKVPKDPNAPKRPPTAFLVWSNQNRAMFKDKYPELSYQDMTKKMGELWKDVPQDVKDESLPSLNDMNKSVAGLMNEWREADAIYKAEHKENGDAVVPVPKTGKKDKESKKAAKAAPPPAVPQPKPAPVDSTSDEEDESEQSTEEEPATKRSKTSKAAPAPVEEESESEGDEDSEDTAPPPPKKSKSTPVSPVKAAPVKKSKGDKKK